MTKCKTITVKLYQLLPCRSRCSFPAHPPLSLSVPVHGGTAVPRCPRARGHRCPPLSPRASLSPAVPELGDTAVPRPPSSPRSGSPRADPTDLCRSSSSSTSPGAILHRSGRDSRACPLSCCLRAAHGKEPPARLRKTTNQIIIVIIIIITMIFKKGPKAKNVKKLL